MVRSPRDASLNLRAALRSHETVPPRDRAVRTGDSESGHFLIPLGNRKRRGCRQQLPLLRVSSVAGTALGSLPQRRISSFQQTPRRLPLVFSLHR